VVSRFRVSKDDPRKADPRSEERIWVSADDPFENHNGGCIAFGPDGYLYITLGDSGAADDPLTTGQNPRDWFGSILRIDVDHPPAASRTASRPTTRETVAAVIPTGRRRSTASACGTSGNSHSTARPARSGRGCRPEPLGDGPHHQEWRQLRLEHQGRIPRVQPNRRQKPDPAARITPPIVEYPHAPTANRKDDGKSITGGYVYRGKELPELDGVYVYGDFDTGRIWGLREANGKALANVEIVDLKRIPSSPSRRSAKTSRASF